MCYMGLLVNKCSRYAFGGQLSALRHGTRSPLQAMEFPSRPIATLFTEQFECEKILSALMKGVMEVQSSRRGKMIVGIDDPRFGAPGPG